MKKLICIAFVFALFYYNQTLAQTNDYYLGVFSNTTKTIKFTIGAYPNSISQSKRNDGVIYSAMRIAIVNNEKAEAIEWSDYKIYILLKDGTLFYNFLTNVSTGDYACKYTVNPGETHLQFVCFEKVFSANDVDKIWLSFSDHQFLSLFLYKDDVQPKSPATNPVAVPNKKQIKK